MGYYKGGWGGDLVLFGLASGQIVRFLWYLLMVRWLRVLISVAVLFVHFQMYSWLVSFISFLFDPHFLTPNYDLHSQMAPEALPLGYRRFVTGASRVSEPCLPVNLTTTRFGYFNLEDVEKALTWKGG